MSKAQQYRNYLDLIITSEKFLNDQPLELQSLVTDCIVDSKNIIEAKQLFESRKEEFTKTYLQEG